MTVLTLKQLGEWIKTLPEDIQDKEIHYIDVSYLSEEELKEQTEQLTTSESKFIQMSN